MPSVVIEKWTDDQCRLLEPLWNLSRARRDSHHIAYQFFNKWHTVVNLPPIMLGAILSTISLKPEAVPAGISAGLAIFITGMSTMNTFFEFSKSREGHRQCYRAFNAIVREIEMNIIRGREDPKRTFVDFMESINDQFSKVVEGSPPLNKRAREFLDSYRGARPSPFDQLLKGDRQASGYDVFMERDDYVDDGYNLPSGGDQGRRNDDAIELVVDPAPGVMSGVPKRGKNLQRPPPLNVDVGKDIFPDTAAINAFNKQMASTGEDDSESGSGSGSDDGSDDSSDDRMGQIV